MHVQLQPVENEDAPFLEALYREVHAPEFAPLALPPQALEQLLAMQFRAQCAGYGSQYPNAEDHLILLDGEPAGRLFVDRSEAEIQLVDIALLARFRSRGIGAILLEQLAVEAAARHVPLRLSVRFDNPALRLYERQGFTRTGGDGLNLAMELTPAGRNSTAPSESPLSHSGVDAGPVVQGYTARYFGSLVGHTITITDRAGTMLPLLLETVDSLPGQAFGSDSFSLQFSGPLDRVLDSEIVEARPEGAAPMSFFLVPNGPIQGRMRYEAIFNRAIPE